MSEESDQPGPIYEALRLVGLVVMTFIVGMVVVYAEMWPYEPHGREAFAALQRTMQQLVNPGVEEMGGIWYPSRTREVGVTKHDPAKVYPGRTLYTSSHETSAHLIDMDGETLHQWKADFDATFPNWDHSSNSLTELILYWPRVHAFPNGDLLALFVGYGASPWGLGLAKFDKDSRPIWTFGRRCHHSFDVAADGTIAVLTHEFRDLKKSPLPGAPPLNSEKVLEDFVVRLSPDGEVLHETSLLEIFAASEYRGMLGYMEWPDLESWDPLHTNDVQFLGEEFAAHYDFAEPDHVVVSLRTTDLIAIVDLDDERVVWATRGFWDHQHDPDPLADGSIMLFDNMGRLGPGGMSRVITFDPITDAVRWTFEGSPSGEFESLTRSNQQPLSNGNVLIVESNAGRMLETTRSGEIVWEFYNPERRDDGDYLPIIVDATRYPGGYFDVEF